MTQHTARLRRVAGRLQHQLSAGLVAAMALLVATSGIVVGASRVVTAPLGGDAPYALLVIGSDKGPPRDEDVLSGNADAMHLVVVNAARTDVSILTFPRDTWTEVVGREGRNKINSALKEVDIDAQVATVENLTGIPIDDWIVTGFVAFDDAIDELGGLQLDVEQRLHDPLGSSSDLQPGVQRLGGWSVLTYARDRASRSDGDLGRIKAHAKVLVALHTQLSTEGLSADRLAEYVSILRRNTVSSLSTTEAFQLGALALQIPPERVHQVTAPARLGRAGNQSVVYLRDSAQGVFADLREDGVLEGYDSDPFTAG